MDSWEKTHSLLWPNSEPPELLAPSSLQTDRIERDEQGVASSSFFTATTLPTSMLFASLCSQIVAVRLRKNLRFAACRALYDILKRVVATGNLTATFVSETGDVYRIPVPCHGSFPTAVVTQIAALDGGVKHSQLKKQWNKDCQDRGSQNAC